MLGSIVNSSFIEQFWVCFGNDWWKHIRCHNLAFHVAYLVHLGDVEPTPISFQGDVNRGPGSLSKKIDLKKIRTINYYPRRPTFKKPLCLRIWRPLVHKTYIECTSFSRSKLQSVYVHFHLVSKKIDWDFIPDMKLSIKH